MSYSREVKIYGDPKLYGNGLRFVVVFGAGLLQHGRQAAMDQPTVRQSFQRLMAGVRRR
jgi:hypothetical protein